MITPHKEPETTEWSGTVAQAELPARPEPGLADIPTSVYADRQDGPWLRGLFRPLLIALVATSLAAGPLAVVRIAVPGWLSYALALVFLAAVEGVYTTWQLAAHSGGTAAGLMIRLAELAVLLLILRVAQWTFSTGLPGLTTIMEWLHDPILFVDNEFLISALLVLLAWGFAVQMTLDFQELALRPDEIAAQEHRHYRDSASAWRAGRPIARVDIMHGFVERWAWGGMLLVVMAAAGRVTISGVDNWLQVGLIQAGLDRDVLIALLCYFLGGLLLISQARVAVLRAGWFNESVPVAPTVLGRWHVLGLVTLGAVAFLAALLPLGTTTPLAWILGFVIGFLVRVFYALFALVMFLWGLLLYPFRSLFSQNQAPHPELDLSRLPPSPGAAENPLPAWLGGAVFWSVVVIVVGYLLVAYLSAHGGLAGGWWTGPWERLSYWWRARSARLHRVAQAARSAWRRRVGRRFPGLPVPGRPHSVRLGTLGPRARVRYFYLSTLHQAAGRGVNRPQDRTPLEFAETLRREWPDADLDLVELTNAFVEARYDDRPIATGQARDVESVWTRIMRTLRRRSAGEQRSVDAEDLTGSSDTANEDEFLLSDD